MASVAEKEVTRQHAKWWDPTLKETGGASPGAPLDGADAAISGRTGKGTHTLEKLGKGSLL